ncbi:UNVERIFIED_CONTAM: Endoplasmic reticulum-Golgi intermediate compartment protein 3, partial [Sesamum radiatum]
LYLNAVTETKLVVDTSRGERLRINFDVTFPALPCSIVSLDAMDISGEQHLDVRHDIIKKRIDAHGNVIETRPDTIGAPKIERPLQRHGGRLEHNETYCGSCYGAEATDDDCCNNCEEVREAYRKKGWALSDPDLIDQCKREGFLQKIKDEEGEGCNIYGFLDVNKVAGNFHFAPGKSFQQSNVHVHDLLAFHKDSFNISHKINRLAFGDYFPGAVNPLDGYFVCAFFSYGLSDVVLCSSLASVANGSNIKTSAFVSACSVQWIQQTPNAMYQYFLKVVPTVFTDVNGHVIQSNQFSVTEHVKGAELGQLQSLPGVFLFYDLSPIKVGDLYRDTCFVLALPDQCLCHCWSNQKENGNRKVQLMLDAAEDLTWCLGIGIGPQENQCFKAKGTWPKALRPLSAQRQHVLVSARIKIGKEVGFVRPKTRSCFIFAKSEIHFHPTSGHDSPSIGLETVPSHLKPVPASALDLIVEEATVQAATRAVAQYIANQAPPQPPPINPQEEPFIYEGHDYMRRRMNERAQPNEEVSSRISIPKDRANSPTYSPSRTASWMRSQMSKGKISKPLSDDRIGRAK